MPNETNVIELHIARRTASLEAAVENLMLKSAGDDTLIKFLEAICDAESHTGKAKYDNIFAAKRLMELGANDPAISGEKLVTVQHAMNSALAKHGLAPHQRHAAFWGAATVGQANA